MNAYIDNLYDAACAERFKGRTLKDFKYKRFYIKPSREKRIKRLKKLLKMADK